MKGLDFIDTMSVFMFVASVTTIPALGVAIGSILALLAFARRNASFQTLLLGEEVQRNAITNWLLPPAKEVHKLSAPQMSEDKKPILTPVFSPEENNPFAIEDEKPNTVSLKQALINLPRHVDLKDYGLLDSSTAVPLGADIADGMIWIDFATDTLHVGLYGQSGCGKDNLMRVWFALLCKRNNASTIQFAILDGKGDWLVEYMSTMKHMFIAPAGGYGKVGDDAIRAAIAKIDKEAERRQTVITQAGVRTREQYIDKTGLPMPLLVVMASDVMTSVSGEVETLLNNLVSKARSLGIRVIVSMQTPTDKDTKWRMNLSTAISGFLNLPSQDTPALGLKVGEMLYRPSELPSPQDRPGVFIVRRGKEQLIVQAPYIDEDKFDLLCKSFPRKTVRNISEGNELFLSTLFNDMNATETSREIVTESVSSTPKTTSVETREVFTELTKELTRRIRNGDSNYKIIKEVYGGCSGVRYQKISRALDKIRARVGG